MQTGIHITYGSVVRFVVPIFLLEAYWHIYAKSPATYWRLVMPEHLQPGVQYLEWFQFFAYAGASAFALLTLKNVYAQANKPVNLFLAAFSLGCLVLALEEVSYGQRVFDFRVPGWVSNVNLQNELNFHNSVVIQPLVHKSYILLGLIGGLGWLAKLFLKRNEVADILIPDWSFSSYFLPVAAYYAWVEVAGTSKSWAHQELYESILSLGIVMFSVSIYNSRLNRKHARQPLPPDRPTNSSPQVLGKPKPQFPGV